MSSLAVSLNKKEQLLLWKEAGADEVILTLRNAAFSASCDFSVEEIREIRQEAHALGLKVSVNANRLFSEEEKESYKKQITDLLSDNIDALIFSDLAVLLWAKEIRKESCLIYDPLTLMTNARDIEFYLSQGIASVSISSLLTKEEIVEIAQKCPHTSLRVFGHQPVSMSRRKLLNEYAAAVEDASFISSRQLDIREESREYKMPIYQNEKMTVVYSDYVQESFAYLREFADAGVMRMEMDSVFLDEDCVLDAIRAYIAVLAGSDAEKVKDGYRERYPGISFMEGYYGWKTVK